MQKFSKSVNLWQSYREFKGGNFFWDTVCTTLQHIVIFVNHRRLRMLCRLLMRRCRARNRWRWGVWPWSRRQTTLRLRWMIFGSDWRHSRRSRVEYRKLWQHWRLNWNRSALTDTACFSPARSLNSVVITLPTVTFKTLLLNHLENTSHLPSSLSVWTNHQLPSVHSLTFFQHKSSGHAFRYH